MPGNMTFRNSFSGKLDDFVGPSPQSPPSDSPFSAFPSPQGSQKGFVHGINTQASTSEVRSTMQRRFTTESAVLPQWNGFNQQPLKQAEQLDILSSATHLHKSQLFEKKRQHIEYMREQKRRFEADLKILDLQQEKERQEMDQIARDLAQVGLSGPVSEPTTPPEYYRDSGFPTALSRPARFSISNGQPLSPFGSVFSPTSQVTSPTTNQSSNQDFSNRPGMGMGLRRNSEQTYGAAFTGFRAGHASLFSSKNPLESEEDKSKNEDRVSTPDVKSYLRMTDPDDKFPTLVRRDDNPSVLSANSAAVDFANSRTPVPENYNANARHHAVHHSMPQNTLSWWSDNSTENPQQTNGNGTGNIHSLRHVNRLSLESNLSGLGALGSTAHQPNHTSGHHRPTSLQLSYSTNDLPAAHNGFQGDSTARTQAEVTHNGYQTHSRMHSRGGSANTTPPTPQSTTDREEPGPSIPTFQSSYQPNAMSHALILTSPTTVAPSAVNGSATPTPSTYATPVYGYGMQAYAPAPLQLNGNYTAAQSHPMFGAFGIPPAQPPQPNNYGRFAESPRNATQSRRNGDTENPLNRFGNVPLENYSGEIYGMCKDQHGCRYLQRKLEEGVPEHVQIIFRETQMHVVELMTDPFGNYLCQKLLEFTNDEQRTGLINIAAPHLVQIALNQHGTRALQKMIEFISTPEQIQTVIHALSGQVVELVQDLNGNHVIQKCLNRLSAPDAQFIYDAVGKECVAVGTHRHGCCVLQRCIDHASGDQRAKLIEQITKSSYSLVQDPFGNYVIQYICRLTSSTWILESLFLPGHFAQLSREASPALSKQKFSSNVIEKCIRTSDFNMRRAFIKEMLSPHELPNMLRDSFANYVIQTAMDFADPESRNTLIEAVRPLLPGIRSQPHGRRIAGKIMTLDSHARNNGTNGTNPGAPLALDEVRGGFSQPYTLPNNQYNSQFNSSEATTNAPSAAVSESEFVEARSTHSESGTTTIFSPVPQHTNNAINGINNMNGINGVNGSNPHGFNMF
ncbi:pumilio domain-containing protein [Nannizzia gypsea CBS 118893]|uniref:Pumilio domain-containing protein n=1 Tax=Arthroderma gypseum (strain ATCC MYA-4604 / CBS 118893) TaxID=535722 RepID=E4UTX9_ARTGP|nr:pumilio domain-containing protein [Nannizzia gypsea CBS 118893]EFR00785.1 pumilio domain-containing protein [Nannizzia gypsea CBS 118893]